MESPSIVTTNGRALPLDAVPLQPLPHFMENMRRQAADGLRPVLWCALPEGRPERLLGVMADDENSRLEVSQAHIAGTSEYSALTPDHPAFHLFERELWEESGIVPLHHPWLKPVRYSHTRHAAAQTMENYPFFAMQGEEVHEVAVGPVHAGIIEPGHFRFQCHGERVHHLEIQLGYQHRGVESLVVRPGNSRRFQEPLLESVAGDSVIAHTWAYAQAMEGLAHGIVSRRALAVRTLALELERMAVHIGDLAAIANDIAYLPGNSVFGALRTIIINSSLALCGSRFGRGLVRVGGTAFDAGGECGETIRRRVGETLADVQGMVDTMMRSPNVLARLEKAGIVTAEQARAIGLVGMAARASGVSLDVRADHPFGFYRWLPVHKVTLESGDVWARTMIRCIEIRKSAELILQLLDPLPEGSAQPQPLEPLAPDALVVSLTEGWRGETVHLAVTDAAGRVCRYKIKDPSFHNWFGLALAVRENGVSDFPLCNKSFNLSYCGHDL